MEIGGEICRTEMMIYNDPIAIEYPCQYYSELLELDEEIKNLSLEV